MVLKELKEKSANEKFQEERRVLTFLNFLDHPSIVKLLNSYSHLGTDNLLFPVARGNLENCFRQPTSPSQFESEQLFLEALHGLASAIEKMHTYSSDSLEIDLIGCHHDLRPKNILLESDKFLLADFGLSTLKYVIESSKSPFKEGMGDYLAPECQNIEEGFEKQIITRRSDIWSFGGIVAEMMTFLILGSDGITLFRRNRKVKVGYYTSARFHAGNYPNPRIEEWLRELESKGSENQGSLIQLVRRMLAMDPYARPTAADITARLRVLAVKSRFDAINEMYASVVRSCGDLDVSVERERYRIWGWGMGLTEASQSSLQPSAFDSPPLFGHTLSTLKRMHVELKAVLSVLLGGSMPYPIVFKLRLYNDQLCEPLPPDLLKRMQNILEMRMVATDDIALLEETRSAFQDSSQYGSVSILAAIKQMSILATKFSSEDQSGLSVEPEQLLDKTKLGYHELAWISDGGDAPETKRRVLVEHRKFGSHWHGDVGDKLFTRVASLARLLHCPKTPNLRALKCCAFYCNKLKHSFSLVFDLPASLSVDLEPMTLASLLQSTKGDSTGRPHLEGRFQLAYSLAACVLEFHKVGWLHKALSSSNILLFKSKSLSSRSATEAVRSPMIIGFNHSRPNQPGEITEGYAASDRKLLDYQHPEYLKGDREYTAEFDYFSLGLILLEIGRWKELSDITSRMPKGYRSPRDVQQNILKEWVPPLGFLMGERYRDVVDICLRSTLSAGSSHCTSSSCDDSVSSSDLHVEFERTVVEQLMKCST